jgi:membrane-bound lytic murein transglycosylase F
VDRQGFRERVESEYLTSETGRLSEFDDLFRQHAPAIGWDWRLLASLAYQESRFDPRARSWAGAQGILQIMPATARDIGLGDPWDPEQNVAGGVRYLDWVTDRWREIILDEDQRRRFVLASYNVGFGHVHDARRLAEKHGADPDDWNDVAYWLLQKSKPEVFRDPVVRYGYARGLEPVLYVALILERFEHYLEFVR